MNPFKYTAVQTQGAAVLAAKAGTGHRYLAGGTNLLDLMKEGVEQPVEVIDISALKSKVVQVTPGGAVSIGAFAKNADTANHPIIREQFPLLSQAILAGASVQIRNMASNGGNLMQRTRCPYFYDVNMPCNKRVPGTGCGAMEGFSRMHAIFGWSEQCIAVHPSDMCVALAALDAVVKVESAGGQQRSIDFKDFHRLPGDRPEQDNVLNPGDLIVSIELPVNQFAAHSWYLKIRDRASYAFALVSVAAALEMKGNVIAAARIALGGVAHKPWRAFEAELFLIGKPATTANFNEAAHLAMQQAKAVAGNQFKMELAERAIGYALQKAAAI